jgi:TRAP-type C4-dicarboxylate transport system substrate-binding protein
MKEEEKTEKDMSDERDQLEKEQEKELSELARRIEKEHAAQLKKALQEHRALFDGLKERQRAIAHNVLQKTCTEEDEIIQKHEQSIDTFTYQAKIHFQELENDISMLKSMIQSLIPLFEQQEVPGNNAVEVPTRVFYFIILILCIV